MAESADIANVVIETTDALIVTLDPEGRIIYFNRACEDLTGYSRDHVLGKRVWDFLLPERFAKPVEEVFERLTTDKLPIRLENPWLTSSGEERVIAWSATVVMDERRRVARVVATGLDVTERRRAEDDLRSSLQLLRRVLDLTDTSVMRYDLEGRRTYANEVYARWVGKPVEELVKGTLGDQLPPDIRERDWGRFRECIATGKPSGNFVHIVQRHGKTMYVKSDMAPVMGPTGLVEGVQVTATDITDLMQTQERLRQSEELYRTLDELSNVAVVRHDTQGRRTFANQHALRAVGMSAEQFMAGHFGDVMPPDMQRRMRRKFSEVVRTGRPALGLTTALVREDGIRHSSTNLTPIRDTDGNVAGIQVTAADITDQMELQRRNAHLAEVLRAIRNVNQLITREHDRDRLTKQACDLLTETRGFGLAWVVLVDERGGIVTVEGTFDDETKAAFVDSVRGNNPPSCIGRLLTSEDTIVVYDAPADHGNCPLHSIYGVSGSLIGRLEHQGRLYGLLGVSMPQEMVHLEEERDLFLELIGDIAYALYNLEEEEARSRAEEALHQSESLYRSVVQATGAGVVRFDLEGRRIFINETFAQRNALPSAEAPRGVVGDLLEGDDRERTAAAFEKCIGTGSPVSGVVTKATIQGRTVWTSAEFVPLFDSEGKLTGAQSTSVDITELMEAHERLRHSEELYRSLVEATGSVVLRVDRQGRRTFAGGDIASTHIRTSENFLEGWFGDSMLPEDRDKAYKLLEETFLTGKPVRNFVTRQMAGSDIRYISANWEPIKDQHGNVVEVQTTSTNITDFMEMQEALRQSEELYRNIVDATGAWVMRVDREGYRTFVSGTAPEIHGRSLDDLLAGTFGDAMIPDDREQAKELLVETFSTGKPVRGMITRQQLKGGIRYISSNWEPIRDAQGNVVEVQTTSFDITDLVETQQALRRSELLYLSLLENTNAAFVRVDRDLNRRFAMGAIQRISGETMEDFLKGKFGDNMVPEDRGMAIQQLMRVFATSRPVRGLTTHHRVNDSLIYLMSNLEPIKDAEGNVHEVQVTIIDISAQIEVERRRMQAERLEALGAMSGGIAHDVNNVLAMVTLWANVAQLKTQEPDVKKALSNVVKAAGDGAETMRRIRRFSEPRREHTRTPVQLCNIAAESIEFTRPMWKDQSEAKDIYIEVQEQLEPVPDVLGNAAELREVIVNLITNAVEAMPEGGVLTIRTYTEGSEACLAVVDTGSGIPEEIRMRIFDPFFTTKGREGSGLGLSAVHGIVSAHDGRVEVQSITGKGSIFTIRLPLSPENQAGVSDISAQQQRLLDTNNYSILVVEDERLVRDALEFILEDQGHQVTAVENGEIALEAFSKAEYDIALVDLGLPGMNGYHLAEWMKRMTPRIPVLLVTGWGDDVDKDRAQSIGIDGVVSKPYEPQDLLRAINDSVEAAKRRKKR